MTQHSLLENLNTNMVSSVLVTFFKMVTTSTVLMKFVVKLVLIMNPEDLHPGAEALEARPQSLP